MRALTRKQKFSVLVGAITLVALALRVYRLDAQSLWWDEVMPVQIARLPFFTDWWVPVFQDRGYPPGLYFLLTLWVPFGSGEFFLRYLSVICGTLAVPIMGQLGARIGGAHVGLIAALLMAISPFYIWYSQELRMYAPLFLATIASSWAFITLLNRPRWNVALGLFVCDVFGLYLQYLFGLFLIAQMLFWLFARGRYPRALRLWLIATFGAGLFLVPWFVALQLSPIQGHPNLGWIPNVQWYDPILSLFAISAGASADPNFFWNWLPVLCALALAVYGVIVARKMPNVEINYLLLWLLTPFFFLLLVSIPIPGRSLYVDRYFAPYIPALLLLIALGAAALWHWRSWLVALVGVIACTPLVFSLWNMYMLPRYARDDWRDLTRYAVQNFDSAHDAVLIDLGLELPFDFYYQGATPVIEHPFPQDQTAEAWIGSNANLSKYANVWLVTTAMPINVHRLYPDEQGQLAFARGDAYKHTLDARFPIEREQWFPGLVLTEYRVQP